MCVWFWDCRFVHPLNWVFSREASPTQCTDLQHVALFIHFHSVAATSESRFVKARNVFVTMITIRLKSLHWCYNRVPTTSKKTKHRKCKKIWDHHLQWSHRSICHARSCGNTSKGESHLTVAHLYARKGQLFEQAHGHHGRQVKEKTYGCRPHSAR